MTATELPNSSEVDASIKLVTDNAQRVFLWNYERDRDQLVTLYNKGMSSQWNSVTDLDWDTDVDPEELVRTSPQQNVIVTLARAAAEVDGSPLAKWGEAEFVQLGVESMKAMLSQFMHGEQGAMIVAAKIVETVPWIDAKYYAATQTMDEARHTEVFAKYLHTKLGEAYPMSPFLEEQITALIEDSRWDIAYLGMQIVIESLALAAFGSMLRNTEEPLLKKLLRYVMSDEARHVAFGVLSLERVLPGVDRRRAQGPAGVPAREHPPQPVAFDHARDLGTARRRLQRRWCRRCSKRRRRSTAASSRASRTDSSPSSSRTSASSACSTRTTATCARSGAKPACSTSSSRTTPVPTTRPTTKSHGTAPPSAN